MCQLFSSEPSPIFSLKNIRISVVELAFATNVSSTRLRYWTRKKYIESIRSEHCNPKYPLISVFKVRLISYYLKLGYTLRVSAIKADEQIKANEFGNIFK